MAERKRTCEPMPPPFREREREQVIQSQRGGKSDRATERGAACGANLFTEGGMLVNKACRPFYPARIPSMLASAAREGKAVTEV
eukprot:2278726-Rhodomonas_salina.2